MYETGNQKDHDKKCVVLRDPHRQRGRDAARIVAQCAECTGCRHRIRGDVNGDGIINAVDLTLAKRGILNGFADRAAEKAADVDRNQITDAKDIAWFRQYLLVETSAYPDAGDDKTPA